MTSPAEIAHQLHAAPATQAARRALGDGGAWIVGGAIRDAILGRDVVDLDLAVTREPQDAARAIARGARGHAFELSADFSTWRVVPRSDGWHVDVSAIRGGDIRADLTHRDFTVNAMAIPLGGGEIVDPHHGASDLEARRLRAVAETSFEQDPLRVLRAARLASSLGLQIDPRTAKLARRSAPRAAEPAGERQLGELGGIVSGADPVRGVSLLEELGATAVVLPELDALRGIEQNPYHHLDVHDHTIEVLARVVELQRDPAPILGGSAAEVGALLAEPLADELTKAAALRLAALFHDLGKPQTRSVAEDGRVLFVGHDESGATLVRGIGRRLRASRRLTAYLEALTRNHLRLGFLVHQRPLSRRQVWAYLKATEPYCVDVTLLTVADRLATHGPKTRGEAIDAHLELAREMIGEALAWRRNGPPRPPIRGDELAAEVGIRAGPEVGRLLAEIEAAQFAGEVDNRDDAIALARERLRAL